MSKGFKLETRQVNKEIQYPFRDEHEILKKAKKLHYIEHLIWKHGDLPLPKKWYIVYGVSTENNEIISARLCTRYYLQNAFDDVIREEIKHISPMEVIVTRRLIFWHKVKIIHERSFISKVDTVSVMACGEVDGGGYPTIELLCGSDLYGILREPQNKHEE